MLFQIFLLSLCAALVACGITHMTECPAGDDVPKKNNINVTRLTVTDCVSGKVCTVKRGQNYTVRLQGYVYYRPRVIVVRGQAYTFLGLFQVYEIDACDTFVKESKNCTNLEPGDFAKVKYSVTVPKSAPDFNGYVRILVLDGEKKVQFCGEFAVAVEG